MKAAIKKLSEIKDRDVFWQTLVAEAVRMTNSDAGYFAVFNQAEQTLTVVATYQTAGTDALLNKPASYPVADTGAWGNCARQRQVVMINETAPQTMPRQAGFPVSRLKVARQLNVPVMPASQLAGILGVANKQSDYTTPEATLLQMFASQVMPYARAFMDEVK